MDEAARIVELELVPISPDTVDSTKTTVVPLVEEALRSAGRESLLNDGDIKVEVRQTFPADIVITVVITLATGVAVETYAQVVLPWLIKRFGKARETERPATSSAP
jgi:hypothetical protein